SYSMRMSSDGRISSKQQQVLWILEHSEEQVHGEDELSYESTLRGLGAWLDDRSANGITVLEIEPTYVVLFNSNGDRDPREPSDISVRELVAYESQLRTRLGTPGGRYQDLLRALGHELDDLKASNLLIDEAEDEILLTYVFRPPDGRLLSRKQHSIIKRGDEASLLDKARSRRKVEKRRRWHLGRQHSD
ncbi:MAG TPA: hypothetical protein VF221_12625, partial [Chloroflexota bacterium]